MTYQCRSAGTRGLMAFFWLLDVGLSTAGWSRVRQENQRALFLCVCENAGYWGEADQDKH